jgi:spore germination cell wall hydrolase CwlJ-like protein
MNQKQRISSVLLIIFTFTLLSLNFLQTTTKSYAQKIISVNVGPEFDRELNCLAQNIYYEAGTESYEGKLAVAQVTINRTNSGKFPESVCGVVKQKSVINGALVCQFSWVCNGMNAVIRNKYQWDEALVVARKALTEPIAHDTLYKVNALYYHANYVHPGWNLIKVAIIGNHIFYKEKS